MKKIIIAATIFLFVSCSATLLVPEDLNPGDVVYVENWGKAKEIIIIKNLPQHKVVKVKFYKQTDTKEWEEVTEFWTYQLLMRSVVK